MGDDDKKWMRKAIALARTKGTDPSCSPIAAVIVKNGRIIARGLNLTQEQCDATAHAEIVAIRAGGKAMQDMDLGGATLYSTLQPCGMCTMASIWAGISHIVYGAGRDDVHRMYFEDRHLDTLDFIRDAYTDNITLEGGCLAEECARLYYQPDDNVSEDEQGNV